jgi:hypothetical protein
MARKGRNLLPTPSEDAPIPRMSHPHSSAKIEMDRGKRKLIGPAFIVRKPILLATIVSCPCERCSTSRLMSAPARPCQRCVKRGLADNCTEGHRKKAKYLLDEEELGMYIFPRYNERRRPITCLEQLKRSKSYATESSSEPSIAPPTCNIIPCFLSSPHF